MPGEKEKKGGWRAENVCEETYTERSHGPKGLQGSDLQYNTHDPTLRKAIAVSQGAPETWAGTHNTRDEQLDFVTAFV